MQVSVYVRLSFQSNILTKCSDPYPTQEKGILDRFGHSLWKRSIVKNVCAYGLDGGSRTIYEFPPEPQLLVRRSKDTLSSPVQRNGPTPCRVPRETKQGSSSLIPKHVAMASEFCSSSIACPNLGQVCNRLCRLALTMHNPEARRVRDHPRAAH